MSIEHISGIYFNSMKVIQFFSSISLILCVFLEGNEWKTKWGISKFDDFLHKNSNFQMFLLACISAGVNVSKLVPTLF